MSWRRCSGNPRRISLVALAFAGVTACSRPAPATASGEGGWLAGTVDQKFDTVAKQLRGFDMAMAETGYRYNELYWAALDDNWGYADYQVKKIRTAVENGLERRPKRAASAETFLKIVLPAVEEAIARRDSKQLRELIGSLRSTCNACHQAEKVEFVRVGIPHVRPFTASSQ
jgi:hypothetical protein